MRQFLGEQLLLAAYLRSEVAAEDYCDERVDGSGRPLHLDRVLSMSALTETEAAARSASPIIHPTAGRSF